MFERLLRRNQNNLRASFALEWMSRQKNNQIANNEKCQNVKLGKKIRHKNSPREIILNLPSQRGKFE